MIGAVELLGVLRTKEFQRLRVAVQAFRPLAQGFGQQTGLKPAVIGLGRQLQQLRGQNCREAGVPHLIRSLPV